MTCVVNYGRQPPVLECTICGGTDPLSLPVTVSQLTALVKVFQDKHALCAAEAELKKAPKWSEVKP